MDAGVVAIATKVDTPERRNIVSYWGWGIDGTYAVVNIMCETHCRIIVALYQLVRLIYSQILPRLERQAPQSTV